MATKEYRLGYIECRDVHRHGLPGPAPGRIQLLTGPRQVGKTTLLLELAERDPGASVYVAADAPETN